MSNHFSQRVTDILVLSKQEAIRLQNYHIFPETLLLGMMREGKGKAVEILRSFNVDFLHIKKRIEELLRSDQIDTTPQEEVELSEHAAKIMKMSILESRLLKDEEADTEHVLLAMLKDNSSFAAEELMNSHVSYQAVLDKLSKNRIQPVGGMDFAEEEEEDDAHAVTPGSVSNSYQGASKASSGRSEHDTPVLDNFSIDMTRAAAEGKLDPVVGREHEIERVAQILSRRKKNNPVLIGEAGVGKSAIVEGLALRIVQKKVSHTLLNKRVVMLDITSVVAGTKYRGQFEERIRSIINELHRNPDVILFIDEIHTIVGAGAAEGSMDAANILKPALARGEIQCIGATTLSEYRKSIEKDGALERRFQKIIVEPTTSQETLQILTNIKDKYEDHHNVTYTEGAIAACVTLAERYITDRCFPDKAIDVLDEVGSRVHLTNITVPKEIEEQERKIEEAQTAKSEAVKSQNFELAASYRDREKKLISDFELMKRNWEESLKDSRQVVDEEAVAKTVSSMTGIPVQRMAQAEGVKLAGMKKALQSKIIAQDVAIDKLTKAILRSRIGLKDPNRPIGAFMFLGPTGVGKTHLTKELAKFMFGSVDDLIRVDMSEYMEKYSVSRLIGSPPGYVGYEEGGQLTEKVRRKPYSIILFDEIEKAHPDVFNLLLQVMDEGRLTDSFGRTVDFKNTIIIMTSNVGTRQLKDFGRGVGFATQSRLDDKEYSREVIQKALNKSFAPEFLNRIDEIITFDQLSLEAIVQIVEIEIKVLSDRVEKIGYKITLDDEAKHFIATKGYDVQFGARPLKRAIQTYLEDAISEKVLTDAVQAGAAFTVTLNAAKDALDIRVHQPEE